jgi:hypothetical protein
MTKYLPALAVLWNFDLLDEELQVVIILFIMM